MPGSKERLVSVAFEPFPAPKGAAVHVAAFAAALGRAFGALDLVTLEPGPAGAGAAWSSPGVTCHALPVPGGSLFERVRAFRARLAAWWPGQVAVAHVRSIYEGYPLARDQARRCRHLVFEVNGLPSIELPYHYPRVADDEELLRKLRRQEDACLAAADLVITPSAVTAGYLERRGVDPARVRVIPNGVDPDLFAWREPSPVVARPLAILYAGTFTAWQGVSVALEALAGYLAAAPATLTLVGFARKRQREAILARAYALGVLAHVRLLGPVTQPELARLHHEHDVALAPLVRDARNVVQGCCPLKVLEAMAAGPPVIASDLPVVAELARAGEEALLVPPGSPGAIREALARLASDPGLASRLSRAARRRVAARCSWALAGRRLAAAYEEVLGVSRASTCASAAASTSG